MLRLLTLGRLELQRDGPARETVALQPKRLALLAYLALSPDGTYRRRDLLLALLWPERSHAAGRHALRHTLYHLRNVLGDGALVSRGSEEIGLSRHIWSDSRAFDEAWRAGRAGDALRLYRGEFFSGVFVAGASAEWDEWVSRARDRFRTQAAGVAWRVAELAIRAGDLARGLAAARRAQELDPDDEAGIQRLMQWLERAGRRPAALRVFGDFARYLRAEYHIEPAAETRALADAMRDPVTGVPPTAQPLVAADAARLGRGLSRSPGTWRLRTRARARATDRARARHHAGSGIRPGSRERSSVRY